MSDLRRRESEFEAHSIWSAALVLTFTAIEASKTGTMVSLPAQHGKRQGLFVCTTGAWRMNASESLGKPMRKRCYKYTDLIKTYDD